MSRLNHVAADYCEALYRSLIGTAGLSVTTGHLIRGGIGIWRYRVSKRFIASHALPVQYVFNSRRIV